MRELNRIERSEVTGGISSDATFWTYLESAWENVANATATAENVANSSFDIGSITISLFNGWFSGSSSS